MKLDSSITEFSLLEGKDDIANIERGAIGLYIYFLPENEPEGTVECDVLLVGEKLFAVPNYYINEWFEAL